MKLNFSELKSVIRTSDHPNQPPATYQPTSVFLLLFERAETHILAIQKSDTEGYPWRNQVALPGGHVDANDPSTLAAAFRELEEELKITGDQVDLIGSIGHFQTINNKDIEVFTGIWNDNGKITYDTGEISRVLEIPLQHLVDTHHMKDFHNRLPDIHELVYPVDNTVIWGTTARILHYFIELLYPWIDERKV